jgi:polyvinyl alcohol dehydrogenase (cytochrome)
MKKTMQATKRRLRSSFLIIACTPCLILVGILLTLVYSLGTAVAEPGAETLNTLSGQWSVGGQNLEDTRNQPFESVIGPSNVSQLVVKWVFTTGGGVSATPTVVNGVVYFPDRAGNVYALNASSGALVWSHQVSDWTGIQGDRSREDLVVFGNVLYAGDQGGRLATYSNGSLSGPGARLIAVNKNTGAPLWITQVESFPGSQITSSPVVYKSIVYVGVSGGPEEDYAAEFPGYPCCSFQGSVVALNALTGQILWKTHDMPSSPNNPGGYSGGSIIGSTPVVDTKRGSLYIGSGNNYWVPQDVQACITTAQAMGEPDSVCDSVDNYGQDYFDSIIALDLTTGAIKWGARVRGYDAWNAACSLMLATCPSPPGSDNDFMAGPNLFQAVINGTKVDIVGEGEKNGFYWAVNPDNGQVIWSTKLGPAFANPQWGSATDGQRVYVPFGGILHKSYKCQPSGLQCNGGTWSALDPATGSILWQTSTPGTCTDPFGTGPCEAVGAVSVANGVLYAGSLDKRPGDPTMFGLDAATGQILWSFASGSIVHSGPAIVGDTLYWGSGYSPTEANKLYAFTLPGN